MLIVGEMQKHVVLLAIFSALTLPTVYWAPSPYVLPLAIAACTSTVVSLMLLRWAGLWESRQKWLRASVVVSYALLLLFYLVLSVLAAISVTWPTLALGLAMPTALLVTGLTEANAPSHALWVSRLAIGLGLLCLIAIVAIGGGTLFAAVGFAPMMASALVFIVYANYRQARRYHRCPQRE